MTTQCRIEDLTVSLFDNFQCDPLLGHFRGEPTLFDKIVRSFLEYLTTGVTKRTLTEDPPPVSVSFWFPIVPVLVPFGLAAAPAPSHPPAVTKTPSFSVAPDTGDFDAPEPKVPERPQLPTQDVGFTNDDILQTDELPTSVPSDSGVSSTDTAHENSVYLSNSSTANFSESPQVQFSIGNITAPCDLRPRLPPRDYPAIQNKIPPKLPGIPVSETAVSSNQLTQSQKGETKLFWSIYQPIQTYCF